MKKLLLILALLLVPATANAQCNGVFTAATVCGSVSGGPPGPVPFTSVGQLPGGTNGQTQYNNSGVFGGYTPNGDVTVNPSTGVETIQSGVVTNSKLATGAANTFKGSLNGASTSDIALVGCSAIYQFSQWITGTGWQCGTDAVLPSRAIAASLNLSAFSVVQTLGYATAGDGGNATFQKQAVGTAFKDQYINVTTSPPIIVGGSGYTNGTYKGVPLGGGSGLGCSGIVVVASGAVTSVTTGVPCPGYKVGDVLTAVNTFIGGTGSGFTWTVAAINTAQGSFNDSAGTPNPWQIITDKGVDPNVKQFGAKLDWNGTDGTATNDRLAYMSAISFCMYPYSSASALVNGCILRVPKGASLIIAGSNAINSASLNVPQGVILRGAGRYGGTQLVQSASEAGSNHLVTLCDNTASAGQFGCAIEDMALSSEGGGQAGTALVQSTSAQQFPLLTNVYLHPGNLQCLNYDVGIGGAANAIFQQVDCEMSSSSTNVGVVIGANLGGTLVVLRDWNFGCAPSNCTVAPMINLAHGSYNFIIDGSLHMEDIAAGNIFINVNNTGLSVVRNATFANCAGANTTAINLLSTNPNGVFMIENVTSGCTVTVTNGHSGGSNLTGSKLLQTIFNP